MVPSGEHPVVRLLYRHLGLLEDARQRHGGLPAEYLGRVDGLLGALAAVDVLSAREVDAWRDRFLHRHSTVLQPAPHVRAAARTLMEELFAAIPQDDDGMSAEANRFEGALVALSAIGALDADWLEARDNAGTAPEPGGTEQDLVAVFGGSGVGSDSARVVVGLCFADGISLLVRNLDVSVEGDDWTQPELADNLDTRYRQVGQRDADAGEWFSFAPALPPGATWIELSEPSGNPIRISL